MERIFQALFLFVLVAAISAAVNPVETRADDDDTFAHQIFDEVARRGEPTERTFTPKLCCKIGRRVASKKIYCNIDLFQVEKKDNTVQREKMKFHGPQSEYETTYKNLMMRVEKCFPNKASRSMFTKCCLFQEERQRKLQDCKLASNKNERRACRRRIKSRE
ncbi:uncharacterized protein [Ptychodera flava]|uniref:uncharacterized protein n=1 Tax=Ptychodera flava TaxID=63121 RepID=UPI00396A4D10